MWGGVCVCARARVCCPEGSRPALWLKPALGYTGGTQVSLSTLLGQVLGLFSTAGPEEYLRALSKETSACSLAGHSAGLSPDLPWIGPLPSMSLT